MESIGISDLSYENITNMKTVTLKQLIKDKMRETVLKELLAEKEKSSKIKALKYENLTLQPYLSSNSRLNNQEKRMLFRWRSHMIKVRYNYGVKDAMCPLCKKEKDTQYHLLTCPNLARRGPWNITSVVSALRLRDVLLEQPNQPNNTVNQTDKTPQDTKQTKNKTKQNKIKQNK